MVEVGVSDVLAAAPYPKSIERYQTLFVVHFDHSSGIVLVERELPTLDDMPLYREWQYLKTRDEWKPLPLRDADRRNLYNLVLYQISLRTAADVFFCDPPGVVKAVAVNGYVSTRDRARGVPIRPCVMSLLVTKDGFSQIDLDYVDPKDCFKRLKGVAAAELSSLAPVPPILTFEREDNRFIEGREIAKGIAEGDNLAMMDWQDFEHLIRELFEWEFSKPGSEVRVTRASRDAGVDAVVFDPDPIHGGKIVVQAKRYTNTVELSAVRDLYGTVVNEGAMKGILITTSDYGPEAYDFAKDKPLTLLNGGHLLHMLEQHGHRARIDIDEARRIGGE